MTERDRPALRRSAETLAIGPSALSWSGDGLRIDVDERCAPLPRRIRGTIRLIPHALTQCRLTLDRQGRHRWWPIAPGARVEVRMRQPELSWSGNAYFDCNAGDEPLEDGFERWDWSRATSGDEHIVLYDSFRRDGGTGSLALRFSASGSWTDFDPPPRRRLPGTLWRVPRWTRSQPDLEPRVMSTLEDTPFYSRSLVATTVLGKPVTAIHESLSLDRFARGWVRMLLPFRMPRVPGRLT